MALTKQEKANKRERDKFRRGARRLVSQTLNRLTADGYSRLRAVPVETWDAAIESDMIAIEVGDLDNRVPGGRLDDQLDLDPDLNPDFDLVEARQSLDAKVNELSNVGQLAYDMMRMDGFDEDEIRVMLFRIQRRAYEQELEIQARLVECPSARANLRNGPILSVLGEQAKSSAVSIVRTYNWDLASAIEKIRSETPSANRRTYAKRLKDWEAKRADWKDPQIELMAEMSARSRAQSDFYQYNGSFGFARLYPRTAVCPVCLGWIRRDKVPLRVATASPPPYHPNCPHYWVVKPDAFEDCDILWMGE